MTVFDVWTGCAKSPFFGKQWGCRYTYILVLLEYVHWLLHVNYLLHFFGDFYTIHTTNELAMWRKLLNICSSYRLFLKFYAMNVSVLLPQFPVSIYDKKKVTLYVCSHIMTVIWNLSPPMSGSCYWHFYPKIFLRCCAFNTPQIYQPFICQAMITLHG